MSCQVWRGLRGSAIMRGDLIRCLWTRRANSITPSALLGARRTSFNAYLADTDDRRSACQRNSRSTMRQVPLWRVIMASALPCRRSAGSGKEMPRPAAELLIRTGEKLSRALRCFPSDLQAELARCVSLAGRPGRPWPFRTGEINLDDEFQLHAPELLRIRGEAWRATKAGCASIFLRAIEISDSKEVCRGRLRAATSLAIAEKSLSRKEAAWRTLQAIHAKFREGLETPDLRLARGC